MERIEQLIYSDDKTDLRDYLDSLSEAQAIDEIEDFIVDLSMACPCVNTINRVIDSLEVISSTIKDGIVLDWINVVRVECLMDEQHERLDAIEGEYQ